eukprot:Polyplicarium_translucidae@DN1825_c0_g1_i5.p1
MEQLEGGHRSRAGSSGSGSSGSDWIGVAKGSGAATAMLISLTTHAVFEGLMVGTAEDAASVWLAGIILSAHKWIEGLVLSANMRLSGVPFKEALPMLGLFVVGTPLGAILGIFISGRGGGLEATGVAIACGTILYVCCVELLPAEFCGTGRRVGAKVGLFALGMLTVTGVTGFMPCVCREHHH